MSEEFENGFRNLASLYFSVDEMEQDELVIDEMLVDDGRIIMGVLKTFVDCKPVLVPMGMIHVPNSKDEPTHDQSMPLFEAAGID